MAAIGVGLVTGVFPAGSYGLKLEQKRRRYGVELSP